MPKTKAELCCSKREAELGRLVTVAVVVTVTFDADPVTVGVPSASVGARVESVVGVAVVNMKLGS